MSDGESETAGRDYIDGWSKNKIRANSNTGNGSSSRKASHELGLHVVEQRAVDERARHRRVSSRNPYGGRRHNRPSKQRPRWQIRDAAPSVPPRYAEQPHRSQPVGIAAGKHLRVIPVLTNGDFSLHDVPHGHVRSMLSGQPIHGEASRSVKPRATALDHPRATRGHLVKQDRVFRHGLANLRRIAGTWYCSKSNRILDSDLALGRGPGGPGGKRKTV